MKKIILTCFLALLCLFQKARIKRKAIKDRLGFLSPPSEGRNNSTLAYFAGGVFYLAKRSVFREAYLKDQVVLLSPVSLIVLLLCCSSPFLSLVAQSPGADSLPTSIGPHRGGETLSDTFLKYLSGTEISSPPLHCSGLSTVDGGPILQTSDIRHRTSDIKLNFGLINPDQDNEVGKEASNFHSTSVPVFMDQVSLDSGRTLTDHLSITILLETNAQDSIRPTLLLSNRQLEPKFGFENLRELDMYLNPGTMAEGSPAFKKGLARFATEEKFSKVSLNLGEKQVVKDLWLQQGDSLALRYDAKSGKTIFWGPDAAKINLQLTLQRQFEEAQVQRNPVMILSDSSVVFASEKEQTARKQALENYLPAWTRKMELLQTDTQKLNRAKRLFLEAGKTHPIWKTLSEAESGLDPEFYDWLKAYWTGKLKKGAYEFVRIANPNSPAWGELLLSNSMAKEELGRFDRWEFAPQELVETLYLDHLLTAKLIPLEFLDWSESLPGPLRDQVNALYLIREYKELANPADLFQRAMALTASPLIGTYLSDLYRSNLNGRPFANLPLTDRSGTPVYPESWKGKVVLVDFWLSGCGACLSFAHDRFFPLLSEFGDHPDLLFVTVSGDVKQETWLNSLKSGNYTHPESINLFSGGPEHPLLKLYQIRAFPAQILIDTEGKILQTGNFPQTYEGWKQLIESYLPANSTATPQPSPTHPKL
ncbi:TlpA disulfide reductase family protein [Algoriphagus sp. AK58]|uniref:TlpA family protein disulfide reductase n=1 Tax=Algoriphagus sp. AK58 TaxID=1406877 RepID=UPI00164F7EE2|nr:TlpA disulfide reductase family protein [Algoriphagus sp. AK58]MBC6365760.1 hypothetical protein [Algoriphagus sp. AK58]